MMAHTFNNAEPHLISRTTSSLKALQEVSSGILPAEIHRKLVKIWASSKITFEPKLVHLF